MPAGPLDQASANVIIENFFDAHKQVYGHAFRDQSTEMVTLRVVATVAVETLRLPLLEKGGRHNPQEAVMYTRRTVFDDGTGRDTPRYRREALLAQDSISGPALVIQHNSTTLIPPGYLATVLDHGDMLIARNTQGERAA
jgi:N-methylhydantoinase A